MPELTSATATRTGTKPVRCGRRRPVFRDTGLGLGERAIAGHRVAAPTWLRPSTTSTTTGMPGRACNAVRGPGVDAQGNVAPAPDADATVGYLTKSVSSTCANSDEADAACTYEAHGDRLTWMSPPMVSGRLPAQGRHCAMPISLWCSSALPRKPSLRNHRWASFDDMSRVSDASEATRWRIHGERVVDDSRRGRLSIVEVELPDGVRFEQFVLRMRKGAIVAVVRQRQVLMI